MQLSILDQSPIPEGVSAGQALANTIALARYADALGYQRYWTAEHHGRALASPAPEILVARIAAETSGIRVGSGGVLLPHYSPLKVAEVFRVLHALYPGRIDLGVGRAPGTVPLVTMALRRDRRGPEPDDFPQQLLELIAFLRHDFPDDHPFGEIHVSPDMPGIPDLWLLGSSRWSASAAAQLGLPYAFAHFIAPQATRQALELYRSEFRPGLIDAPRVILALGVLCAPSAHEAAWLRLSSRLMRERLNRGLVLPVPTPESAKAQLGDAPELKEPGAEWPRYIYGDPKAVKERLVAIADTLGVGEIMALTVVHDHTARVRSYELLGQAFGLPLRDAAPTV